MDPQLGIAYCKQHGKPLEKYRVAFLFENQRDDERALGLLQADELPDGGFPYRLKPGNPACLSDTAIRLGIIVELDLLEKPVASRTADFLLSQQGEDGGWDENPALLELDPPSWDRPGELGTRTWLTGEIIRQVARVVGIENKALIRGCDFLLEHFDGEKIAGYRIASGLALAAMSWTCRENESLANRLVTTVDDYAAEENDAAFLNWYLECFVDHGLTAQDREVAGCLDKLEVRQRSDGAWGTEDGAEWSVNTTINALKHLRWAGRW